MTLTGIPWLRRLGTAGCVVAAAAAAALRRPATRIAACALALALAPVAAQAPLDVRVALVIGNAAYAGKAQLLNPANDARAMSGVLRSLGFNVTTLLDAQRKDMAEAIAAIGRSLKGRQGVGMLYYAGHGVQLDWHNYMVPVDARLASAGDVPQQTVDINLVMDTFKSAGARMNIMVLDACRDNPFSASASGKGLAQQDAPPGTFLAYATAPGNVAEDGDAASGNGLYTQYLLAELRRPAARIEDVFKRVRFHVRQQSQGRQIPWESTSLEDDFYFNDGVKYTISADELRRVAQQQREEQEARQREAADRERARLEVLQAEARAREQAAQAEERQRLAAEAAQREARQKQQAEAARIREEARLAEEARLRELALQEIAQQQAQAVAAAAAARKDAQAAADAARAKAIADEKRDWEKLGENAGAQQLYDFLQKYPNGYLAEAAQFQLDRTEKPRVTAQANKAGVTALPAGQARYQVGDVLQYLRFNPNTGGMMETTVTERVTAIEGNRVLINNGRIVRDLMGNSIGGYATVYNTQVNRTGTVAYDAPAITVPSEIDVGKTWRSAWTARYEDGAPQSEVYATFRVQALEDLVVPAGTFKAWRIRSTVNVNFPLISMFRVVERTYWLDSATLMLLKQMSVTTSGRYQGGAPNEGMALAGFVRKRPAPVSLNSTQPKAPARS